MTGLNLETFLQLVRADLGIWISLGAVALILGLMTWTNWGSKRALRNCLVLSIGAHLGLIVYGSASPAVLRILRLGALVPKPPTTTERVRVQPWVEPPRSATNPDGRPVRQVASIDQDRSPMATVEPVRLPSPPPTPSTPSSPTRSEPTPVVGESVTPEIAAPGLPVVEAAPPIESKVGATPPLVAPGDPSDVGPVATEGASPAVRDSSTILGPPDSAGLRARSRPDRPTATRSTDLPPMDLPPATLNPTVEVPVPGSIRVPSASKPADDQPIAASEDLDLNSRTELPPAAIRSPGDSLTGADLSRGPRPARPPSLGPGVAPPRRLADGSAPIPMALATPAGPSSLPTAPRSIGRRSLAEVPPVYRSRLDPNRTSLAQRAGASPASEQAVERALDWLARHQDLDGRWDGGSARMKDGNVVENDDSYTIHCPPGEICFGECYYWEADTALTGLSLLAYLGAGYTQVDGKYASTVAKGIEFLIRSERPDGDLRGSSLAVGMYCHSMATLALCEAYALTGDPRLRDPVERAVGFLVRGRARDGLAWRYAPGAPSGDTSILGWAVMALKSAKTVGIPIPPPTQAGILGWLKKVATGPNAGLARYQPTDPVTATMTAEAWACRQFLEVGGPGKASDEAAGYLVQHPTDGIGEFNIYYLYYGTLAMYQHGGDPWSSWNGRVRDQIVGRQHLKGHKAGSWDPDDSRYGTHGGRIYGTALATLTLEVYYRFLRLYEPSTTTPVAPRPADPATRRAGIKPFPPGR